MKRDSKRWRWIAAGAAGSIAVIAVAVGVAAISSGTSPSVQSEVIDIAADGRPLVGQPIDLIGVSGRYVGLIQGESANWTVTSDDGLRWEARRPDGLPTDAVQRQSYPGGLNNVNHVLFTDGDAVYLRAQSGSDFNRLGSVSLFVSNAEARTWEHVVLPAPAGKGAFPIVAATAGDRKYIAGAVYDSTYGRSYLDAAVWVSDGASGWTLVDAPAFSGDGNQTIFSLDVSGENVIAGGGDGSLVQVDTCCFYPDGLALWRSVDRGDTWARASLDDQPYGQLERGAVVGFIRDGSTLHADVVASPPRGVVSHDRGASWIVTPQPRFSGGVAFPRVSQVLRVVDGFVATTVPADFCADCEQGALAHSTDGARWQDVTPRFPCGTGDRASYGFVSPPVTIGASLAALGGCGPGLNPFNETLLATSTDNGIRWRISRFNGPTGGPIPAVAGNERIVTFAGDRSGQAPEPVRAVVVHR